MTPSQSSSYYCINPRCTQRENPVTEQQCQSCQTSLLVHDRYRLISHLRPLNVGGNAELFEVEDLDPHQETWGTTKVLKVLSHTSRDWIRLFRQEARALIWLNHPGVPNVEPDGYFTVSLPRGNKQLHCLVMEKIEGQDLEQWIEQHCLDQDQAIDWLKQLANILQQVHRYDLLHRDIKPSNIMLKPDGQLVLIDFGTVSMAERGTTAVSSLGYTAPEQGQNHTTVQSDLFALGRTIVHLLTRIHPCDLPLDSSDRLIWRNAAPNVSPWFADLLDRMIDANPRMRPRTGQALLQELEARSLNVVQPPPSNSQASASSPSRTLAWLRQVQTGTPLLLAMVLIAGGYSISRWLNDAGAMAHLSDRWSQAQWFYQWAQRLYPDSAIVHYNQGVLAEDRHDIEEAIGHYRQVLQDEQLAAAATNNLARIYIVHRQEYTTAVNLILPHLTTVKDNEAHYSLLKNLGWARYQQERYTEAQIVLQQAIALAGERAPAHCLMAQVMEAQKKPAIAQWEACLSFASVRNLDEDGWIGMAKQRLK